MLIFYIHKTYLNWSSLNFPDCRKYLFKTIFDYLDRIDGVRLACSPRIKPNTIWLVVVGFSANHAALRSKNKDWLARNKTNVYEWSDMSTLLFHWSYTNSTQRVGLGQSGPHYHLTVSNLFSPWYSWQIVHLALKHNHSLIRFSIRFLELFWWCGTFVSSFVFQFVCGNSWQIFSA